MSADRKIFNIAILDDYQNVARTFADWSSLGDQARISVFNEHFPDADSLVERLQPFQVVCIMRERTALTRDVIARLPNLRLIASTGARNAAIDVAAAAERGIDVAHTAYSPSPTIELTWALILASVRNLLGESHALRTGGWQRSVGDDLMGHTLSVLGLGRIGTAVAKIGRAFGMQVLAWSQNLTAERAAEAGACWVSREELFRQADVLTVHLVLSRRTRGLVGAHELALMKPTARLVNTSRGPIIIEQALIAALQAGTIAGAALDVFDQEPLPLGHAFRVLANVLATPHIGYVSRDLYRRFYEDSVDNIRRWIAGQP